MTLMHTLGDFQQGRLFLYSASRGYWQLVDAHGQWFEFDPREFHATEPWCGPERFSILYFVHGHVEEVSIAQQEVLEDIGFAWPRKEHLFKSPLPQDSQLHRISARKALIEALHFEAAAPFGDVDSCHGPRWLSG